MKTLFIKGDMKAPQITCTYASGTIDIIGRSHPEHASCVYDAVVEWIDEYVTKPQPKTTLTIMLEYFNTSSSKMLFEIFKQLEALHQRGKKVVVNWYYEDDDEDMKHDGQMLADIANLTIMEFVPIKEFSFDFIPNGPY